MRKRKMRSSAMAPKMEAMEGDQINYSLMVFPQIQGSSTTWYDCFGR